MSPHTRIQPPHNTPTKRSLHLPTPPRRRTLVAAIALAGSALVTFPVTAGADGMTPEPVGATTTATATADPTPAEASAPEPTEEPSQEPAPPLIETPSPSVTDTPAPTEESAPAEEPTEEAASVEETAPVEEPTADSDEAAKPEPQAKKNARSSAADRGRRTTYFFSRNGSDSNNGLSPRSAFRSVDKVAQLQLGPRDRIKLERGSTFKGQLQVWQSGAKSARIRVMPYGRPSLPAPRVTGDCVHVYGSWVAVVGIVADGCRIGFYTNGNNNVFRHVTATHNMHGIEVGEGAQNTRVVRNRMIDNQRMAPNTPGEFDDYGAVGVVVMGDRTVVAHNLISGSVAPSADFGTDGSAVEIYGGRGTRVHHNVARNNRAFTELGNKRSADTKYFYNVSMSNVKNAEFLVTRGRHDYFGPVKGTVARNNTVRHTGAGSQGFWCAGGCDGSVLALFDNIIDVRGRIGYTDGSIRGARNIYWGAPVEHRMMKGDRVANPQFANVSSGTLHVKSSSPAVDRVKFPPMRRDLSGLRVPTDGNGDGRAAADVGAYETGRG